MEIINFLIGQLVGLVEPFLAIDFIIKCLGWKEGVRHRKNHCMNMEHLLEKGEYESLDKYLKQFVSEELGEVR